LTPQHQNLLDQTSGGIGRQHLSTPSEVAATPILLRAAKKNRKPRNKKQREARLRRRPGWRPLPLAEIHR
jgi:hypothetical protein